MTVGTADDSAGSKADVTLPTTGHRLAAVGIAGNAALRLTADYPPVWLAGFGVIGWVIGRAWPIAMPGHAVIGVGLIIAGLILMTAAAMQMRAMRTTLDPHGQPSSLVTGGIYRFSRNPIYLADLVLLAGVCVLSQALLAAPILVAGLAIVLTQRFILPEEARLQAHFGDEFTAFARRTRRWF